MKDAVETVFLAENPVVTLLLDIGQFGVLLDGLRTALETSSLPEAETVLAGLTAMRVTGGGGTTGCSARGQVVRCAGSWVEKREPKTGKRVPHWRKKEVARELVSTDRDFRRCPVVSNAPTGLKYRMSLEASMAISVDEAQLRLLSDALRSAVGRTGGPESAMPGGPSRWELRELDARLREVMACWEEGECRS
jgi:hypothetical protein